MITHEISVECFVCSSFIYPFSSIFYDFFSFKIKINFDDSFKPTRRIPNLFDHRIFNVSVFNNIWISFVFLSPSDMPASPPNPGSLKHTSSLITIAWVDIKTWSILLIRGYQFSVAFPLQFWGGRDRPCHMRKGLDWIWQPDLLLSSSSFLEDL